MKLFFITLGLLITANAFATQACLPGTLPVYKCSAVKSDDGIYRQMEFDITVCQGRNKLELVSVNPDGKREALNATKKQSASKVVYTMLDEDNYTVVARLSIPLTTPEKSKLQIDGDSLFQKRICRKIK